MVLKAGAEGLALLSLSVVNKRTVVAEEPEVVMET